MVGWRVLGQVFGLYLLSGILMGCAAAPGAGAEAAKEELAPRFAPQVAVAAPAAPSPPEAPAGQPSSIVNILLLGVDSWETLSGRSDAIVLVSVDVEHGRVLLTSVPRDMRVSLDGLAQPQRINAAYARGGAPLARATLERVLDVDIPYYAVVNFSGFARIIDTLGGVTIDVPSNIIDLEFPAMNGVDYEPFIALAGLHHFDGETALKYARTRKASPDGDFNRIVRQQQVLRALKAQALTPRALLQIPALYVEFRNAVDTDLSLDVVVDLARLAATIEGEAIASYAIDETSGLVTAHVIDGVFVLEPDIAGIRAGLNQRLVALAAGPQHVAESAGS